jgi:rubrerythrin
MTMDDSTKEAIKMAVQMEKDGYGFYTKAAARTQDDMGSKIFTTLAKDEQMHLDTFQKIFEDRVGKDEWDVLVNSSKKYADIGVFPKNLGSAESGGPAADTNELDALHMAMDAEKHAVEFYSQILEKTDDQDVQGIISEIIKQEKNHYLILQEEFTHLSNTGYWYELNYLGG